MSSKIKPNQIRIESGTSDWGGTLNNALEALAERTGWYEDNSNKARLSLPMTQMMIQFMKYMNDQDSLAELLTSEDQDQREIAKLILEFKDGQQT